MRLYITVEGPIGAQDANFASSRVQEVYATDLVNTLGRGVSRQLPAYTHSFIRSFGGFDSLDAEA